MELKIIENNDFKEDTVAILGRDLHTALGIKTKYADWFSRMLDYGFIENVDYILVSQKRETNNPKNPITEIQNHQLTLDMAKEVAMVQRSDKGKQVRQYFIQVEKEFNSPERLYQRALMLAEKGLQEFKNKVFIMQPKADYYDKLADSSSLFNFRETAKALDIKLKDLTSFLIDNKLVFRNSKGNLVAYASSVEKELLELKEVQVNEDLIVHQSFVTTKGKQYLFEILKRGTKELLTQKVKE